MRHPGFRVRLTNCDAQPASRLLATHVQEKSFASPALSSHHDICREEKVNDTGIMDVLQSRMGELGADTVQTLRAVLLWAPGAGQVCRPPGKFKGSIRSNSKSFSTTIPQGRELLS